MLRCCVRVVTRSRLRARDAAPSSDFTGNERALPLRAERAGVESALLFCSRADLKNDVGGTRVEVPATDFVAD